MVWCQIWYNTLSLLIVEVGWWEHWASLLHFYFYVYLNITINNNFKLKKNKCIAKGVYRNTPHSNWLSWEWEKESWGVELRVPSPHMICVPWVFIAFNGQTLNWTHTHTHANCKAPSAKSFMCRQEYKILVWLARYLLVSKGIYKMNA